MNRIFSIVSVLVFALGISVFYFFGFPVFPPFAAEASDIISPLPLEENIDRPYLPASFQLPVPVRKQTYQLSCEFSAAAAIIYFFTGDPRFDLTSQEEAEKMLIADVGISQNPDVGIRMGQAFAGDKKTLYRGLDKPIGGTSYYGVHAPPFLDLFAKYKLVAVPIEKNGAIEAIKSSLVNRHLVMAWVYLIEGDKEEIDTGSGQKMALVRGEHTVVVHGYDVDGFWVMDPGLGRNLHIPTGSFLTMIDRFSLPLLDISKTHETATQSVGQTLTDTEKKSYRIRIENGNGQKGKAGKLVAYLQSRGYQIKAVGNADNFLYDGLLIRTKKSKTGIVNSIRADLSGSYYPKLLASADLPEHSLVDALLIIGR